MVAKIVDDIWDRLKQYTKQDYLLVTDKNIYTHYGNEIMNLVKKRDNIYILEPGEQSKSLGELSNLYKALINKSISRNGIIISLGGGVIGDLCGFAAATYKRGISYIQVPTTLLSQVDSSVGGKTGIDFEGYKNIIGSFYFPIETLIKPSFLDTLPKREITCGLGEVLKYGLIRDYNFFEYTMDNIDKIYNRDKKTLFNIIEKSIDIKSSIYKVDKYDTGIRQTLNFGHTIGHGIESLFEYKKYNHGEAVILGIIYESKISYDRKLISKDYYEEILSKLEPLVEIPSFNDEEIDSIVHFMKNDKKNIDTNIRFILPIGRGKVEVFQDVDNLSIRRALS